MKNLKTLYRLVILAMVLPGTLPAVAQDQATPVAASGFFLDVNTLLVVVVGLLFVVIATLAYILVASLDIYKRKRAANAAGSPVAKSCLLLICCMGALQVFGQEAEVATVTVNSPFAPGSMFRYLLLGIVGLELLVIFVLVYWIRFFTGIADLEREKALARKKRFNGAPSWWIKANKLKPLEQEASLDVGHSYDGIRELDNATPPWFTIAFIASIIFALGYLWRYHVGDTAPGQYKEYEIAVTKANLEKEAYLKLKGDAVNENTVVMLDGTGIEAGKVLYEGSCTACHGNAGQGGVGPNLTDNYWLHGGSIGSVFKTIKLGVVEKGMMSWKDIFSAEQIAQLASYIKSIKGSNPPGSKEKQGDLYEEAPVADSSKTAATSAGDSLTTAKL